MKGSEQRDITTLGRLQSIADLMDNIRIHDANRSLAYIDVNTVCIMSV
jgi:hypothetical protein